MSVSERQEIARVAVETIGQRLPVLVHTSASSIDDVIQLSQHAQSIGADGVLLRGPYHWQLDDTELERFFVDVSTRIDIGLWGYNHPTPKGPSLSMQLLARLLERCPGFVGLKDTTLSFGYFTEACRITSATRPTFSMLAGDEYLLPSMAVGGAGSFAGTSAIAPRLLCSLYRACSEKHYDQALRLQYRVAHLIRVLHLDYPVRFKAAMGILGRPVGGSRRPLKQLGQDEIDALRETLAKLGVLEAEPQGW
jgi:4-hydroxy-tetrahydrodipicolinate synthase